MQTLKILLVEDRATNYQMLKSRLPTTYSLVFETNVAAAKEAIRTHDFDLVLIDLQLDPQNKGVYEGIHVGEFVKQQRPHTAIVMYSASIKYQRETSFTHHSQCVDAGAIAVVSKPHLMSTTQAELTAKFKEWMTEHRNRISQGSVVSLGTDLRSAAVVDQLGGENLEQLLRACYPEYRSIHAVALQAGYSGAAILKVTLSHTSPSKVAIHQVLKVSRQPFDLADELARRPVPGSALASHSVAPNGPSIVERSGLFGIASAEVREHSILRDFLRKEKSTPANRKTLLRMVDQTLVVPAQAAQPWQDWRIPAESYAMRPSAIHAVAEFLDEAREWKTLLSAAQKRDLAATRDILGRIESRAWGFVRENRLAAVLHGDFHTRNIFVAINGDPTLIDFGRSEVYPRLFDFAALDVDLILTQHGFAAGAEHRFESCARWLGGALKTFPFSENSTKQSATLGHELRSIIHRKLLELRPRVSRAEYAEVLLFHLLRYMRFPTVPRPAKIVAAGMINKVSQILAIDEAGRPQRPLQGPS